MLKKALAVMTALDGMFVHVRFQVRLLFAFLLRFFATSSFVPPLCAGTAEGENRHKDPQGTCTASPRNPSKTPDTLI